MFLAISCRICYTRNIFLYLASAKAVSCYISLYLNIIHLICHFFYTGRIFENQILHPKKQLKTPKTLKISLKKSNVCSFFHPIWKNLHLTENFYTGTACGAGDKYEVWKILSHMVQNLYFERQLSIKHRHRRNVTRYNFFD